MLHLFHHYSISDHKVNSTRVDFMTCHYIVAKGNTCGVGEQTVSVLLKIVQRSKLWVFSASLTEFQFEILNQVMGQEGAVTQSC